MWRGGLIHSQYDLERWAYRADRNHHLAVFPDRVHHVLDDRLVIRVAEVGRAAGRGGLRGVAEGAYFLVFGYSLYC